MQKNSVQYAKAEVAYPTEENLERREALFPKLGIRFCWKRCGCSQRMAQRFPGWPGPSWSAVAFWV